ncbi:MAG: chemotaxis-specific protein-glutamate methyltransferase CheB [Candidatus Eremiobacteraeota bacterium]|nr:chemotaxis-specific protein-glutamate methyltransferase CheB [Candidatus Eremiobacteraeota bacterium]MCW5871565.1 chemotaxis-specific protein-glutamate methyltransferase CheB [Candidatus Eremiobacteraeota bacterium]
MRVLVADDSPTARQLIVELLRSDPELVVVGEAADGTQAVAMTRALKPDVITMDLSMPGVDGFEATRQIMAERATPIVIVSASVRTSEVEISMRALGVGALTVIAKPPGPQAENFELLARRFVNTVKSMSQVKVVRRWDHSERRPPSPARRPTVRRARVVAMAASTGGPAVLARILSELPAGFSLPILVVQHISPGFTEGFAAWLNTVGCLSVAPAVAGESLRAGQVYIAAEGFHLGVAPNLTIQLDPSPLIQGFRPSANYLFHSVAQVFGRSVVAVILTGMGRDGVEGLRSVREAGGTILAQDESSSVVFGMPGAALKEGLVDDSLNPAGLARRLRMMLEGEQR